MDGLDRYTAPPSALSGAWSPATEWRDKSLQSHSGSLSVSNLADRIGFSSGFLDAAGPVGFGGAASDREIEQRLSSSLFMRGEDPASSCGSPFFVGSGPGSRDHLKASQRWNPFDGIGRHWDTAAEKTLARMPSVPAAVLPMSSVLPEDLRGPAPVTPLPPSSLLKRGSLEQELSRRDQKVQALLETLSTQHAYPITKAPMAEGHIQIVVPHPLEESTLGMTFKDMTVTAIADPKAFKFGWAVGDRVLCVNSIPVSTTREFSKELSNAIHSDHSMARPVVFDVWRHLVAFPGSSHCTALAANVGLPAEVGGVRAAPHVRPWGPVGAGMVATVTPGEGSGEPPIPLHVPSTTGQMVPIMSEANYVLSPMPSYATAAATHSPAICPAGVPSSLAMHDRTTTSMPSYAAAIGGAQVSMPMPAQGCSQQPLVSGTANAWHGAPYPGGMYDLPNNSAPIASLHPSPAQRVTGDVKYGPDGMLLAEGSVTAASRRTRMAC